MALEIGTGAAGGKDNFSDITAIPPPKKKAAPKQPTEKTPYAVTGTVLRVTIYAESWEKPGTMEILQCGQCEIDSITLDGPPDVVTIKAVSVPLTSAARRETKSQGWEDVTLKRIAMNIAERGYMGLIYDYPNDPYIDRVDQRQEPDLSFLQRICTEQGASMKVIGDSIVIFDETKYEAKPPMFTFKKGDGYLISYSFTQDSSDTASSAEVAYKDPKTGKLVKETFAPETAPAVGQTLKVNTRPPGLNPGLGRWTE